jgi:SAM-dependent methyltransferase
MASSQPIGSAPARAGTQTSLASAITPPCRVCHSSLTSPLFVHRGVELIKCAACTVVFSLDEPDLPRIVQHYSTEYFSGNVEYADYLAEEPSHRTQACRYLNAIRTIGITGTRLFDIGCATGFFLDEARKAGWEVAGCDVSEAAVGYARDTLRLPVGRGDFLQVSGTESVFDVVTAFNVFEHLPKPRAVADHLARIVRPGGHLVFETWDHQSWAARLLGRRWHQWDPPFVPYYYTRQALETLFPPDRWQLVHYRPFAKRISVGRALTAVRARYLPGFLGAPFHALASGPVGRVQISYGLDDLVLVAFKRL